MTIPSPQLAPDEATSNLLRELDFDRNPTPMWVFDAKNLAFLAVNDVALGQYGYSRKEFLAMTILDIRPNKDIVRLVRRMLRSPVLLAVREIWTHEKRDHSLFAVEITSHEILFNGRPAEIVTAAPVSRHDPPDAPDSYSADHLCGARTGIV